MTDQVRYVQETYIVVCNDGILAEMTDSALEIDRQMSHTFRTIRQ